MRQKVDRVEQLLLLLMFIAFVLVLVMLLNQHDVDVASYHSSIEFAEPVNDVPLMTEREKAWARESHVGSFWYDGSYWVVEGMPSEYWEY